MLRCTLRRGLFCTVQRFWHTLLSTVHSPVQYSTASVYSRYHHQSKNIFPFMAIPNLANEFSLQIAQSEVCSLKEALPPYLQYTGPGPVELLAFFRCENR